VISLNLPCQKCRNYVGLRFSFWTRYALGFSRLYAVRLRADLRARARPHRLRREGPARVHQEDRGGGRQARRAVPQGAGLRCGHHLHHRSLGHARRAGPAGDAVMVWSMISFRKPIPTFRDHALGRATAIPPAVSGFPPADRSRTWPLSCRSWKNCRSLRPGPRGSPIPSSVPRRHRFRR